MNHSDSDDSGSVSSDGIDFRIEYALRRVQQNDDVLTNLWLCYDYYLDDDENEEEHGFFTSDDADEYSVLGAAIGSNTHLNKLEVGIFYDNDNLAVAAEALALSSSFFDGLRQNTSIQQLWMNYEDASTGNVIDRVYNEIMRACQVNKNLTYFYMVDADLQQRGGGYEITNTLRSCISLKDICFDHCGISDEQCILIVDAVRGHVALEVLMLSNRMSDQIGNAGCEALATLLEDPNCNLNKLYLSGNGNSIDIRGTTSIANSLVNNTKLQFLSLHINPIDQRSAEGVFCRLLCNTSSINETYSSNHILERVWLASQLGEHVAPLLEMNKGANKSHVAIKKILLHHPNLDMGPLFDWDADGEQTLKALPYVISWFGRAEAVEKNEGTDYHVETKKLSALFQFSRSMPLLFVPASSIKQRMILKKRKRYGSL